MKLDSLIVDTLWTDHVLHEFFLDLKTLQNPNGTLSRAEDERSVAPI